MNRPLKLFLDHLTNERKYSPKTVDSYRRDVEKFFDFRVKNELDGPLSNIDLEIKKQSLALLYSISQYILSAYDVCEF